MHCIRCNTTWISKTLITSVQITEFNKFFFYIINQDLEIMLVNCQDVEAVYKRSVWFTSTFQPDV